MTSKECEEQLESLVEAWRLNEADLNQTDIEAIKHLLLENQMQQDKITELRIQVSAREEVANKYKEVIEEVRGYANEKIKFNDDQIKEYKTCITTNINGKFPKEVKENMEHSMTISMCINYKLKNIVQILDKVKEVKE